MSNSQHRRSVHLLFVVVALCMVVGAEKGTPKDIQGVLRHARLATTTDVYMQEIPESVKATIEAINRKPRKPSKMGERS